MEQRIAIYTRVSATDQIEQTFVWEIHEGLVRMTWADKYTTLNQRIRLLPTGYGYAYLKTGHSVHHI